MLDLFRDTYPNDQVEHLLKGPVWEQVKAGYVLPGGVETNHVFRAAMGKKCDLWCNLVRMTSRAHHYFHKDHVGGIVVCMKSVLSRETDIDRVRSEWQEAFGKHPLWWLHGKLTEEMVPEHYVSDAIEILSAFRIEAR